jgi:DNA-binding NarL/FixJ family response regulator
MSHWGPVYSHLFSENAWRSVTRRCARLAFVPRSGRLKAPRLTSLPFGLRASKVTIDGEELAVFSFPLPPPALPESLSAAERDVAIALLEGLSNAEIAATRGTAPRTVANQVAALLRKLGVRSRTEAVAALGRLQRS